MTKTETGAETEASPDEDLTSAVDKQIEGETADKQGDLQIYGRLLGYVVPYWGAFLLSIVGFVIYSASNVGFVQLIAYIVDSLGGNDELLNSAVGSYIQSIVGTEQKLNRTVIPFLIVTIVFSRGIGTFIGNYFITYIGTNLVHNLRVELFERLLLLPSRFYDKNSMGHLVAKVTFHVTQVTGAATDAVKVIIREGLTVLFYLGFLFYLNWKLTLIFIAVAPLIGMLVAFAGKRFRRISERIQDSMGDVTHVASEAVQGYREVRTFGGQNYERDRFLKVSHDNRRQSMKMVITSSIATPTVQLVVSLALAGLVWLALDPVLLANMSSGDIVAFITTGGLLAKPIRQLSEINATVQKGLAAAEDIFQLFDEPIETNTGTHLLDAVKGKIEFRNVSFAYNEGQNVLTGVSFCAEPGETIALVGKSGSGKSTLASLIPRFYSPTEGQILLDDVPIDQVELDNLRQHMAIVTQDVTLFNDTVARNIAYGSLNGRDLSKIQTAAEKAYAWGFIEGLSEGLNTLVGDDGVLLSGGQRQRLAIARAFLKDAPILILDEATSALDSESERYIQSALEAVSKGRTTFVIAHRLSTIENADRILVVEDGKIVEQGTHAELLAKKSHYAGLHNLQHDSEPDAKSAISRPEFKPIEVQTDKKLNWLNLTGDFNPLVSGWYNDAKWVRMLQPLSWLFTRIARHRRNTSEPWQAPVPVIVVGNINVGGTGKTPLVAWLAEQLAAKGLQPGIVSRGYGGKSDQYPISVTGVSDTKEAGDEAVMLARKTGCPVVVDPDRVAAVQQLLGEESCDVVISDDGLQHYALGRDVEIVVIDSERGLGNGLCMPAGPLREPPSRLDEVDMVVVNGDNELEIDTPYIRMSIEVNELITLSDELMPKPEATTVHAVAGIGNPDRFFCTLKEMGFEVVEHRFDDHHRFELTDLSFGDSLPVIMTEKDAVKCRQLRTDQIHQNFWYLDISVKPDDILLPKILSKIGLNIRELNPARKV